MFKDKIRFYISQTKSISNQYIDKFMALHKFKKIAIFASPILVVVGVVLFATRLKPLNVLEIAGQQYTFDSKDGLKPFAHFFPTVGEDLLLEKMVVNLKQTENHKYAMGMFEVFLNLENNDLVKKIKDNEYLIQDVLQRELESFSYEKLSTPQGKKVAKILLRNRANKAMGEKIIKRLYFKTFVIQP